MCNWSNMPKHLQLGDVNLAALNKSQMQELFVEAKKCNLLDEFSDLFWSQYSQSPQKVICLQDICTLLEEFKRTLGREHSNAVRGKCGLLSKSLRDVYAARYNEVELAITWLCKNFDCERTSKPYFLPESWKNDEK